MPLLDAAGKTVADTWVAVADDAPLPGGDTAALIPFARLKAETEQLAGRNAPLGVLLASDAKPEDVAPFLDRLALVAVEFPKFRDGRGFTIARTLRERYGYKGEIRAVGHILPDQYVFLLRCGVSTVAASETAHLESWQKALGQFTIAYQPAATGDEPLSLLRRHLTIGKRA
jgi:uncharacterized protein (DUF934 family)